MARWFFIISSFAAAALLASCERWDLAPESFPEASTLEFEPDAAIPTEGILRGAVSGLLEDELVDRHGHVWSFPAGDPPSVNHNLGITALGKKGNGSFQSNLNGLTPGKTYSCRAYIIYENQVKYGELKTFTTGTLAPVLSIDSISANEAGSFKVKVYATVSSLPAGLPVQTFGITWGENPLPHISTAPFVQQQGIIVSEPAFQFAAELLLPAGESHLRPFLVVGDSAFYGNDKLHRLGNVWVRKTDFGGPGRKFAVGFDIGQRGYIGTGYDDEADEPYRKDFWEYDPQTGTWAQKADFGGPARSGAAGFSIGQKGYIGTGSDASQFWRDFWEYDPQSDTWARKADFGGTARNGATGFSIGQKGYIGTGSDGTGQVWRDFWEFDPNDETNGQDKNGNPIGIWHRKADFGGAARDQVSGFAIGPKGYIGLGWDVDFILRSDFWEYDPGRNSWIPMADFGGGGRIGAAGFAIGQKGYIGMGTDGNSNRRRDFWEYDPANNRWTRKADYGGNDRETPVGFAIGQRGFAGTGWDGRYKEDFWEYVPD